MSGQGGSGYSASSSSTSGLQAGGRSAFGDINVGGLAGKNGLWITVALVGAAVIVAVAYIVRKT